MGPGIYYIWIIYLEFGYKRIDSPHPTPPIIKRRRKKA